MKTPALPKLNRRITIQEMGTFSDKLLILMNEIREQMLAPRPRKKAPTFTISQVAALCGVDRTRINYVLTKDDTHLPKGTLQGTGRSRVFSLAEAQEWIRAEGNIPARPAGVLGDIIVISNFKAEALRRRRR
jgi:chromosome partitioning protein